MPVQEQRAAASDDTARRSDGRDQGRSAATRAASAPGSCLHCGSRLAAGISIGGIVAATAHDHLLSSSGRPGRPPLSAGVTGPEASSWYGSADADAPTQTSVQAASHSVP